MRFSASRFNSFLNGAVRQNFTWRKASTCPCVTDHSGAARPDCPLCKGKGQQWAAPVAAWAGMTGLSPKKAMEQFGSYETGDATLTIPSDSPLYAGGRFDRIMALDSTNPFSTVLRQGLNDRLTGRVISIDRVFWISPDGSANVEGAIPTISATGALAWPTGGGPPPRTSYTVSGIRHDELFVFNDLLGDRNIGVPGLPRRANVRVFDLFGR